MLIWIRRSKNYIRIFSISSSSQSTDLRSIRFWKIKNQQLLKSKFIEEVVQRRNRDRIFWSLHPDQQNWLLKPSPSPTFFDSNNPLLILWKPLELQGVSIADRFLLIYNQHFQIYNLWHVRFKGHYIYPGPGSLIQYLMVHWVSLYGI